MMDPYGNKIRSVLHPKDWRHAKSQKNARSPLFGPKPGVPGPCPPGYTDVTKGDLYKTGRVCRPPGGVKQ